MIQWRKSSRSDTQGLGDCVEVSTNVADTTLIRDSKNPEGPRVRLGRNELAALLGDIKAGQHDP